jgi:acetyl esterase/lipase
MRAPRRLARAIALSAAAVGAIAGVAGAAVPPPDAGAAGTPAARAPAAFTPEGVLGDLRPRYPAATLPPDGVPAGVTSRFDVVYAQPDGQPLALDLFLPTGRGPHPALIILHGGGWERGDRRMERPLAAHLAARGYAAATVSYRLGPAGRFPNALADARAAVRWLRAQAARLDIDPGRIGAVGGSAGGQLVALLGASNGDADARGSEVQAVVDIDGLADFTGPALREKESRNPGAPTRFLGGGYAARAAVWREASALSHVGPRSAPTLFIDSTAPTPILPGRAEMCARLRGLGVACEMVVLPDTPHPFWLLEPWFSRTLAEADRFLAAHLQRRDQGSMQSK